MPNLSISGNISMWIIKKIKCVLTLNPTAVKKLSPHKKAKRIKENFGTFTKSKIPSDLPPLNSIPWTN